MDNETKNKLVDGAIVVAKSAAYLGATFIAMGVAGSTGNHSGGIHAVRTIWPRPINMWRNQRRVRAFQDALDEAGVSTDFEVKVTVNSKEPKVTSLQWAAFNWAGWSKAELAYYLYTHDGVLILKNGVRIEMLQ